MDQSESIKDRLAAERHPPLLLLELAHLEQAVTRLRSESADQGRRIGELEARAEVLEGQVADLEARVATLEAGVPPEAVSARLTISGP